MNLFLGIDLGTSYYKLGLFDGRGDLLGLGRVAAPMRRDEAGRAEIPVDAFWAALREGLAEALKQAKCSAGEIRGVSYASQANTFLLLGDNDQPLTPLVSWTDRRVGELDPAVAEFWARPSFLPTTGLGIPVGVEFAAMKIRWFQTHQPDLWRAAKRVMSISDYLTFRLTGRYAGDAGTAALLGLLNLPKLDWWDEALAVTGLKREQLSTPHRPGCFVGEITSEGAKLLGVPVGVKFVAGSLDHHVAALGAGVGQIAPVSVSLGTVLACLACSDDYAPKPGCIMGPGVRAGEYYQLAFDENGASVLEWYRNTFAPDLSFAELSAAAGTIPAGCDGLTFDKKLFDNQKIQGCRGSRSAAEQPRSSNTVVAAPLRGSANHGTQDINVTQPGFRGENPSHTQGHFVRAIMESTARTASGLIHELCDGKNPARAVATGGGAQSEVWLGILSQTTGVEFLPAPCKEAAVRGAAMLAVVA